VYLDIVILASFTFLYSTVAGAKAAHTQENHEYPNRVPRLHVVLLRPRAKNVSLFRQNLGGVIMLTILASHFFRVIWHLKALILMLAALIVAGAASVTLVEKMPFGDTLYFAFVTGLTIGYGDIVVKTPFGRLVAILIGFIGILFTGLMVAVLVLAVRESYEQSRKVNHNI